MSSTERTDSVPQIRRAVRFIQNPDCTIPRRRTKNTTQKATEVTTAKPSTPVARDIQCLNCFMLTPKANIAGCIHCGEHLPPKE